MASKLPIEQCHSIRCIKIPSMSLPSLEVVIDVWQKLGNVSHMWTSSKLLVLKQKRDRKVALCRPRFTLRHRYEYSAYCLPWWGPINQGLWQNDLKTLAKRLSHRNLSIVGMTCTHHFVILLWKRKYMKSLILIGIVIWKVCCCSLRRWKWLNAFLECPLSRHVAGGVLVLSKISYGKR